MEGAERRRIRQDASIGCRAAREGSALRAAAKPLSGTIFCQAVWSSPIKKETVYLLSKPFCDDNEFKYLYFRE